MSAYRGTAYGALLHGCTLLALLAWAAPAAAEQTLVVAIDPALVQEVCAALPARDAKPAAQRFESEIAKQQAAYAAGMEQVAKAETAYQQGQVTEAWSHVTEGISLVERNFAVVTDFEGLARAYLFKADLANARGDEVKAEDSFLMAARFAPNLKLDPASTSPIVIDGFKNGLELLQNSPTGGLSIVSTPEGASVRVNGKPSGKTPLSLVLPAGPQLVVVQLEGYAIWATQVPAEADNVRNLEVYLTPASPLDAAALDMTDSALRGLSELDAGSAWLVVRREGDGVRFAYMPPGAEPRLGGPVPLEQLDASLSKAATSSTSGEETEGEGLPGWIWIAGGSAAGVLLLGGAAAVATVLLWPDDPPPEYSAVFHK